MEPTTSRPIDTVLANLDKLTARELKNLCKARNITGYSKLPKAGVIEKILDWQKKQATQNAGSATVATQVPLQDKDMRSSVHANPTLETLSVQSSSSREKGCLCLEVSISEPVALQSPGHQIQPLTSGTVQTTTESHSKRPRPKDPEAISESFIKKKTKTHDKFLPPLTVSSAPSKTAPAVECKKYSGTQASGRRYKALIPTRKLPIPTTPVEPLLCTGESFDTLSHCLSFVSEAPLPRLQPISLPPSVAQRRHVPRLSLLLSCISVDDLRACTLVSRLFRYSGRAVFLSDFSLLSLVDAFYSIYGSI